MASSDKSMTACMAVLSFLFLSLPKFTLDFLGLILFCTALAPGFCRYVYYYVFVSGRLCVVYKEDSCRQTMDVYRPTTNHNQSSLVPVVVYVPGGGWLIGYKLWGALLARVLTAVGLMVVTVDHRNYPLGTVPEQVDDLETALEWIGRNIQDYGGNPKQLILVGESAGGHIAFMSLWRRHVWGTTTTTTPPVLGLITFAVPFDLNATQPSFVRHGMSREMTNAVFGNQREAYDPYSQVVKQPKDTTKLNDLPPMILCQGVLDQTVPYDSIQQFVQELRALVVDESKIRFRSFPTWRHTDACLDALMEGNLAFPQLVVQACRDWTSKTSSSSSPTPTTGQRQHRGSNDASDDEEQNNLPTSDLEFSADLRDWPSYLSKPLCPPALLQLGRFCMPIH